MSVSFAFVKHASGVGEFGLQPSFVLTLDSFCTSYKVCLASLCTYSAYLQHASVPKTAPRSHQSHFVPYLIKSCVPAIFSGLYSFCLFPGSEGHRLAEGGEGRHCLSCGRAKETEIA